MNRREFMGLVLGAVAAGAIPIGWPYREEYPHKVTFNVQGATHADIVKIWADEKLIYESPAEPSPEATYEVLKHLTRRPGHAVWIGDL